MSKCPDSVRPHVFESILAQKGATAPRMSTDSFSFQQILVEPAKSCLCKDGLTQTSNTSPQKGSESFSFYWLLAELARAHDRELRQALAAQLSPPLAQGQALPRSPPPEGHNVFLDGAGVLTTPRVAQHQQLLVEDSVDADSVQADSLEDASTADRPSSSIPPSGALSPKSSSSQQAMSGANGTQKGNNVKCSEQNFTAASSQDSKFTRKSTLRFGKRRSFSVSNHSFSTKKQKYMARLTWLLGCEEFEIAVASVIMLNIFVIFFELQYVGLDVGFDLQFPGRAVRANIVWAGADTVFFICDWFFGILFGLELVVKIMCLRKKYWYDSQSWDFKYEAPRNRMLSCARFLCSLQGFNIMDFICVVAFLADKMAASSSVANPQMLRMLRLFRLTRLVRLLRYLETMDHLYIMTTAISGLATVLAWAIALLTVVLVICDMLLVQILQVTYFNNVSDLSDEQLKKHQLMYTYFGTCTRCMLSMFEITFGNWPPVARLLSEEVSEWFTVVCLLHKLTIGFAVVGVITGVILQETFKVAQQDDIIMLRQKQKAVKVHRQKMEALFNTLDVENDGKISESEFMMIGKHPEIKAWLACQNIETDDLQTLFTLIDEDGSGYITIDELFARMPRIAGSARSIDMLKMKKKKSAVNLTE